MYFRTFSSPIHTIGKSQQDKMLLPLQVSLNPIIRIAKSTNAAYEKIFGGNDPHISMKNLVAFNRQVLNNSFRDKVFVLLSQKDPFYYYRDPKDISEIFAADRRAKNKGVLLSKPSHFKNENNPHHLIPESRGGIHGSKNTRIMSIQIHNEFHRIFANLSPAEQLGHMGGLFGEHLTKEFSVDLTRALSKTTPLAYYQRNLLRPEYLERIRVEKCIGIPCPGRNREYTHMHAPRSNYRDSSR